MTATKLKPSILLILFFLWASPMLLKAQIGDRLPVREYTNPDEVVTFDRSVSFSRALDVLNEFSKKYRDKLIIDRSDTEGSIGISIPTMHWMDALKTILQVKQLQLVEGRDFYEIVTPRSSTGMVPGNSGSSAGKGSEDGPIATLDTREVRINAIFFEGNRRALKEVGVDWSTLTNNVPENLSSFVGNQQGGGSGGGGGGGQGGGGQSQGQLPDQSFDGPFVNVNSKGAQNVSQNVFNSIINLGEIGNSGIRVQALFSAFEADNLGEILASPTVKVMDGEEGRIQVGQDFSIKQRDFAGNVVEEFFSVGTILTVTPQIITQSDTSFIHLDINAERSSAQPDPVSTIINKQQAETQSLLLDGEATVLAGLYRTEKAEVRRGIPILKDLPPWFFGLRYLFGYNSEDYQMRELVILVQASLEPSVPQRYAKEKLDGKFEILQDERERMRDEIKRSEEILNRERPERSPDEELMEDTREKEDVPAPVSEKKQKEKKPEPAITKKSSPDSLVEEDSPPAAKPEVDSKEVPLDFNSKESEEVIADNPEEPAAKDETEQQTKVLSERPADFGGDVNSGEEVRYYIVGGSFGLEANATDMQTRLQESGFNSVVINNDGSSLYLVTYGGYERYSKAASDLKTVQGVNSGAWLYVNR